MTFIWFLSQKWKKKQSKPWDTFSKSFISRHRAQITPTKYKPNMVRTVANTKGFDERSLNASKTASKSIGFGATKKPPPKFVKCVQRHTVMLKVVSGPTFGKQQLTKHWTSVLEFLTKSEDWNLHLSLKDYGKQARRGRLPKLMLAILSFLICSQSNK